MHCLSDDVVAGHLFGAVMASPTLCARLEDIAVQPGVQPLWLTDWCPRARRALSPFPGRAWPTISERSARPEGTWWKLVALEAWLLRNVHVESVAWCDDHIGTMSGRAEVERRLKRSGLEVLLVAPKTAVGLTPTDLELLDRWATPNTCRNDEP
jgi:hypothetical protein